MRRRRASANRVLTYLKADRKSARCAGRMVPAIREARARVSLVGITEPGTEFFRPETKPKFRVVSPARDQISKIVRRTGRVNAACSHKVSVIRDLGDCVVADAVTCEPVSTVKFPANREKYREFRQIRPLCEILKADTRANTKVFSEIPYATEQGIISAEQEILVQEQGIFPVKSEIIIG